MPPSMSFHVSLSRPMFPEQKTIPFAFMAWEKTGRGAGALAVRTSVMGFIFGNRVFRRGVLVGFMNDCRTRFGSF